MPDDTQNDNQLPETDPNAQAGTASVGASTDSPAPQVDTGNATGAAASSAPAPAAPPKPQATADNPLLIASIEVYQNDKGAFQVNLTAAGHTLPQHTSDDIKEVVGRIEEFLFEEVDI